MQLLGGRERHRQPARGTVRRGLAALQADRFKSLLQAQQQAECSERLAVRSNGGQRGGHNQDGERYNDQREEGEERQQQQQKQGESPAIARQRYLRRCLLLHELQPARAALLLQGHPAAHSSKTSFWVPSEERSKLGGDVASDHAPTSNGPAVASQRTAQPTRSVSAHPALVNGLSDAALADLSTGGGRSGSSTPTYLPGWDDILATPSAGSSSTLSAASADQHAARDRTDVLRETQVGVAEPCGLGCLIPYLGPSEPAVHAALRPPPCSCWVTQLHAYQASAPTCADPLCKGSKPATSRPVPVTYLPSRLAVLHALAALYGGNG